MRLSITDSTHHAIINCQSIPSKIPCRLCLAYETVLSIYSHMLLPVLTGSVKLLTKYMSKQGIETRLNVK